MRIVENFDLTAFNSYRIKSKCKRAFFPESVEDFIEIYTTYKTEQDKILLGGGYNIILAKEYYEKDFILIGESFSSLTIDQSAPGLLVGDAGVSTLQLSNFALDQGLKGVEIFYDIPSSLGGAVVMNAGASGEEIKDVLVKVQYLDRADMLIKEIHKENIGFQYRNSFFQKNTDKLILRVWLQLSKGDAASIKGKMEATKQARWSKQPKNLPNAGSVFKRPPGHYVGPMIEKLGLKGFTVGGAQVSNKHAGFIVNVNDASGQDILDIIGKIQREVSSNFSVDLEVEQRIIW